MRPIRFENATKEIGGPAAGQPEYIPLPIWTDGYECRSRWKLSWRERISALVFGRLSLSMLSGSTQPPVLPRIHRREDWTGGES